MSLWECLGVQSRLFSWLAWFTPVGSIAHGIRISGKCWIYFKFCCSLCGMIEDIGEGFMALVINLGAKANA